MCFDVPKFVRSPGCDHGHDEESRNGRDIKIDILDHVIRTPEVFRIVSGKNEVPEGLPEPPGEANGPPWALLEKERGRGKEKRGAPPFLVLFGLGRGGAQPTSCLFSSSPLGPM